MNAMASPPLAALDGNGVFAVNLLAVHNKAYADTFSGRPASGKPFDFANHAWRDGDTGLPLASEAEPLIYCNRAYRRIISHEGTPT